MSLQQMEKNRITPKQKKRLFAAAAALAGLLFAFLLLVPVRLTAKLRKPVHAYETLEKENVLAALRTTLGVGYPVKDFAIAAETAGAEPAEVEVTWKNFTGTLRVQPISFTAYTMEYAAAYYELTELDPAALTVTAEFADGFSRVLNPEEYTIDTDETEGELSVTVQAVYGTAPAGTIDAIRFERYRFLCPDAYAGQPIDPEEYDAVAIFADGTERPAEGIITMTDTVATEQSEVSVSSKYGAYTEKIPCQPISEVESFDHLARFAARYPDGTEFEMTPEDTGLEFAPPEIIACAVEGEKVRVTLRTDETADCIYAVYPSQSLYSGTSLVAGQGSGEFTLTFPLEEERLLQSFQAVNVSREIAAKASAPFYITNPEATAKRTFAYPQPDSKKGLQINPFLLDDVQQLNIKHCVVNITMDSMLGTGISYTYQGKEYQFNENYIRTLDGELETLGKMGIITTAVLLMRYTEDSRPLIYPSGRTKGYTYYGLNMADPEAREYIAAMFTFLAERYADETHLVLNWVLGNEVNDYVSWNFCGYINLQEYIGNYAAAFHLLYNCTRSVYADSRCLISLDHCWNQYRAGTFTARQILDAFAAEMERTGDIEWGVAFHAYSEPLRNAAFWLPHKNVSDSLSTPIITMKNLPVLTDYLRETYGAQHRVYLSENGFSSVNGEELQAAAIAYAYYLAEANDMVDGFMLQSHSDNAVEMRKGLYFGLWYNDSGEWGSASRKKLSWTVFQQMDANPAITEFALKLIGADSWRDLLP